MGFWLIPLGILVAALSGRASAAATHPLSPTRLRCEYLVDPLGIGVRQPRLSWEVSDPRRGAVQSAYQVRVASREDLLRADKPDLWDSGKVASSQTAQVAYAGRALRSGQPCVWQVRTWDGAGQASPWSAPARWTMGLLSRADWGARWIGDGTPIPPADRAHNGYHSEFAASPDTPKGVTLDLGQARLVDGVRLFPARPFDWQPDTPGFLFPVRFHVAVSESADPASFRSVLDRTGEDLPSPGTEAPLYRFAPTSARYIRLQVTRLAHRDENKYAFALAEMQVLSGERNVAEGAAVTAGGSIEQGAWSARNLTDGDTTSHRGGGTEALPPPMLRKEFRLDAPARRATLSITALGLYEARLNGRRVGDHLLAPEWTDYRKRVQYQTYDVTSLLRAGANALGVQLGDGWYAGRIGMAQRLTGLGSRWVYGRQPLLLLRLDVELADGRHTCVVSDESWRATTAGPIRSADILDGEGYDARRETPGWDAPGFAESAWAPARVFPEPGIAVVSQPNEPIRITHELTPVGLTEPKPGVWVYDLGQNLVGWARMKLSGAAGTTVVFRHGEMLNPDGTLYTANLRGAPQEDRCTLRGEGPETFEPHFTYHGFRYVEVTGLPGKPALADLTGCVFHSAAPEVGSFECSSPLLNTLWQNILWTQRANLEGVPTDCPQRDERLGWMGDIQAFAQTAIFNMDMAAFFTKWLQDVRDGQLPDGRFPDFAPHVCPPGGDGFTGVPAWGDAGVIVPWRAYVNYGDTRLLAEQFPAAKAWVEYIRKANPDLIWRKGRGNDYNDWLNADTLIHADWPKSGGAVPNDLFATAFFAHSTDLVARMAAVLRRSEDTARYRSLSSEIRAAFRRAFLQPDGRLLGDTQAGYALALHFDLLPEELRPAAVAHLVEGLDRYHGHLSTGIQSTIRLMLELTRAGHNEEAYHLAQERTFPSWGFMIDQGATTVWERWDGYVAGRGFQNAGMNSFNHWALGAVGEWLVRAVLGIEPDEAHPGYEHFTLHPRPGGGLAFARGEYRSLRGRIAIAWKREGGRCTLDATVPANTTATLFVPTTDPARVTEGGRPAVRAPGVRLLRSEANAVVYEVSAGTYRFESGH